MINGDMTVDEEFMDAVHRCRRSIIQKDMEMPLNVQFRFSEGDMVIVISEVDDGEDV